ncbi:hypothetical protein Tco_1526190, partial [Tanacetum coccineum]
MVIQNQLQLDEDEAIHKELGDSLVRAATTTSSVEAEQENGNINKTRSKATPNESSSQGTNSGGDPRRVKKLEKKNRSRTHRLKRIYKVGLTAKVESSDDEESMGEDASKQGRIDAIDADEEITLVSVHDEMEVDEETSLKLQAEFDKEERLAKIDADHQLAERLQAQEQEELSIEENATLFQQLLAKRRKHFAAKR